MMLQVSRPKLHSNLITKDKMLLQLDTHTWRPDTSCKTSSEAFDCAPLVHLKGIRQLPGSCVDPAVVVLQVVLGAGMGMCEMPAWCFLGP